MKLRTDGTVEWQKTYGGAYDDWAESIQQTSDDGYVVAGYTESFGLGNLWVLKLKPDGTVEWEKTYKGGVSEAASSIQQTSEGGYIVAGYTSYFTVGDREDAELWVLKLRPNGTVEWRKAYGGSGDERAKSIQQTSVGYIVAGVTESFGAGDEDFWVLKLKTDGSIDPSCHFIIDTGVSEKDSNATVKTTSVDPVNSNVSPRDTPATIKDTHVLANFLCQQTPSGD